MTERVKNTLEDFFPLTIGTGTGDEAETQEEEEDDDEIDDFESQVNLNGSTHGNRASTNRETGDWLFGSVWCGQDNKQDYRRKTAGKRVYDHDKFGGATRKEQEHMVK